MQRQQSSLRMKSGRIAKLLNQCSEPSIKVNKGVKLEWIGVAREGFMDSTPLEVMKWSTGWMYPGLQEINTLQL